VESPIVLVSLSKLHALARKFAEVLIASVATLLVTALWSNLTKPAAPAAQADGGRPFVEERLAADDSKERLDDFMERIALSHVAALKGAPPTQDNQSLVATAEPPSFANPALASRPAAAKLRGRPRVDKAPLASADQAPLASDAKVQPAAPSPLPAIDPVVASAPSGVDWLRPVEYGVRLAGVAGDVVVATNTRAFESLAYVGGALTSFGKKW
jgi:hypothetical protein